MSGLIPNIGYKHELDAHEATNITKATLAFLRDGSICHEDDQFDYSWMLSVHRAMFCDVWDWAGKLRIKPVNIGLPPIQVEQALYQLAESVPFFPSPPPFDTIAYLHHRLVQIHPFTNGNGRWSRLVSNVFQLRTLGTVTRWPDKVVGTTHLTSPVRGEYISALQSGDKGDLSPLAQLHERFTTDPLA